MTLLNAILKKVQSHDSIKRYASPPPELKVLETNILKRKKKLEDQYDYIRAKVDSSPPGYEPERLNRPLRKWSRDVQNIHFDNIRLLLAIRHAYLKGKPRVVTTECFLRDWKYNKQEIIRIARTKFILFPVTPHEDIEDRAFIAPYGIKRPRVYLTLRRRGGAILGTLVVELFDEVCPNTCKLFLELLDGDTGYGYVGTKFYRKVPHLFCSGGDVVYDNGFGCYAQKGRICPIGAENYHFSHSMPGLLSMRVTRSDEMCGIFNITFKPLPQFDLKNVVFGRVVRPSSTNDVLQSLGSPLGTHPEIEICSARRRKDKKWLSGIRNTKIRNN